MKRIVLLVLMLIPFVVSATTTTSYDFSNRTPGSNIFAFEGISGTQIPSNNSFPSSQYSSSSYSDIVSNNNVYHDYINYSKNQYPAIRYVIEIDEEASSVSQFDIFWNGYGVNSKRNKTDGVRIYIWNDSNNDYELVTQNTNDWVVELSQSVTSNITDYIDNDNQVTIYVVSQEKTFNNQTNWIGTDYFSLSVTADDTPTSAIANFQFDECAYTGTGNEVIDQLGNYSGTSHNSLNTSDDAQIEKALGISSAQHHVQVSIPLPETFSVSTWFKKPTDSSGNRYFILGAMASGGDLLYIDRDNGWRWGIYDAGAGTSLDGSYSFSNLDNNWHYMAVVYKDEQSHLYIDGSFVETINLAPSGTLKYIGTSFDDFGTSTPQGFRAPLDEFIVFDGALTADEISSIYNYQNTGNNYDGGARTSVQCAQLIAQFSMDELSWEGMSGVVIDELGSYNANAINGPVTSDANRAISDNPGTCGYGVFDGVNDYVELPSSFENLQDSFTITAWINPSNLDSGSRIFADDENNQGGYALSLSDQRNGNGHLRFYSRRVSPVSLDTSAGEIPTDTWSFVTAVHDSVAKTRRIYINGVERASGTYTGNWGTDTGPATIGGETDDGEINNRFTGSIDEVHVFKGALTATEINEVYAKTHACAEPVIHHYEIVHDGNGLTCAAEPITIKACTNSDCSSLSTESVSLDFNVNGVRKYPVTFIGSTDLNDPTFSFNHTTVETVTLSIANATVNASNAFECSGFGSSCEMTFAETGFQFLADGVVNNINTQLSGKPSNIDFNNQRISLQAIKTNPVTGACEAAFTNDVEIEFVAECIDPSSCAGRKVAINNVPISTADDADTQSIFTNIALGFGDNANNTADIILSYPDAGKVQLHARYNIPVDGVPSGNYMLGNSNTFVVRPLGFYVEVVGNKFSENAAGEKFTQAGEPFQTSITAKQWESDDDQLLENGIAGSDGIADSNDALSNNTTTPNFVSELKVEHALIAPSTGNVGSLTGDSFNLNQNGTSTNTMTWSEVGIISITANIKDINNNNLNDYLGVGPISSTVPYVGRFTPAYFTQKIEVDTVNGIDDRGAITGKLHDSTCQMESWVYSGQITNSKGVIRYANPPVLTIAAFNTGGIPTKNYFDDFAKIKTDLNDGVSGNEISFNNAESTHHENNLPLDSNLTEIGNFEEVIDEMNKNTGVLKYTLSNEHHFTYIRNADSEVNPFFAAFELPIKTIKDSDDVFSTTNENPSFVSEEGVGVEVRFGRWFLENSYGPETSQQIIPSYSQYLDQGGFITNIDDNCSVAATSDEEDRATGLLISEGTLTSDLTGLVVAVDSLLESGKNRDMILTAPGENNIGDINIEYTPPPWLLYDWDGDGIHDDNPTSTATFGLYRGNDRIISWREVNN